MEADVVLKSLLTVLSCLLAINYFEFLLHHSLSMGKIFTAVKKEYSVPNLPKKEKMKKKIIYACF